MRTQRRALGAREGQAGQGLFLNKATQQMIHDNQRGVNAFRGVEHKLEVMPRIAIKYSRR